MYYLFLCLATVLYSTQFVFNKAYQRSCGDTFASSCAFSAISSLIFGVAMLAVQGFKLSVTGFSVFMAIWAAINGLLGGYFGIIAMSVSDLAKYSLYLMLGGMAVPFLYGIVFDGDALTWQKIACFVTIALALIANAGEKKEKKKESWKAKFCYAAIFVSNGFSGVIATMHQHTIAGFEAVSSRDFIILTMFATCILTGAILILLPQKDKGVLRILRDKNLMKIPLLAAIGYGVVHGIAELLSYTSLQHIEPSVQYPIITGGCVILSVISGLLFGERITKRKAICAGITLIGTLFLTL